ncbi:MAG TPA: CHC2 zinc finger domain-containing protein, partial [Sphingobacteriaceae bacterium]
MILKETIDKILETALIEEVVGDFVHLKKRGASLIGNCPFHNEKTPSFNVSPSKGIYKCFGCGKGGDAVRFIMEHEKYSYP